MPSGALVGRLVPPAAFSAAIDKSLRGSNVDYTRVVLLSYARSGSTLIQTLLDSHPNVLFFHEPFNPRKILLWKPLRFNRALSALRDLAPDALARSLCTAGRGESVKAVGFKLFYASGAKFPSVVRYLDTLDRLFVIRLTRKALPRLCSIHMVNRTTQWHDMTGTPREPITLRFTPHQLETFFAMDDDAERFVRRFPASRAAQFSTRSSAATGRCSCPASSRRCICRRTTLRRRSIAWRHGRRATSSRTTTT